MELIEIKEILRKASVEVDIQGYGKRTALFETDFERVAIELVEKLTISCSSDGCYECGSNNLRPKEYNCLDCGHDGYCY